MRFVQFIRNGMRCIGVELAKGGDIINLNAADQEFPTDMRSFIEGGDVMLKEAKSAIKTLKTEYTVKRDSIKLLAPITSCDKVLCIGMNYVDHCEEQNVPVPKEPVLFNKFPGCITGPADSIEFPEETKCLDWEVELVIVVGKKAKNIKVEDAMQYVFGYTVANDFSARDWQLTAGVNGGQWLIGKAMDDFCPLGPAIVTLEDLDEYSGLWSESSAQALAYQDLDQKVESCDPHNLGLRCRVNDVIKQESNTNQLVHKTEQIIAYVSRFMTLYPGDLILTGTPPGVGCFRKPPEYLKKGDVVEVEIDQIGTVVTRIV